MLFSYINGVIQFLLPLFNFYLFELVFLLKEDPGLLDQY